MSREAAREKKSLRPQYFREAVGSKVNLKKEKQWQILKTAT